MMVVVPREVFPESLETPRLQLYRPRVQERAIYARQFADAYSTRPKKISLDVAERFADFMIEHWRRYGFGFLIVSVRSDAGAAQPIGHAGFKHVDAWPGHWAQTHEAIELGYALIPTARGNGYITECVGPLLTAAFSIFDVATILGRCSHDNDESADVMTRCGMTEVASNDRYRNFEIARPD